jgi:5-methylcytosine-specific restriction endonuclease McrA
MPLKYTKEVLEPLVRESSSYGQIIDRLGLKRSGGTQANLVRRVQMHGLSTAHFLGRVASGAQARHKRLTAAEVLVLNRTGRREPAALLRRVLLEAGVQHRCKGCGQDSVWNGMTLMLHVDHVNGDYLDNRLTNLRFLCPNCHSQTPTFGTRNRKDLTPVGVLASIKMLPSATDEMLQVMGRPILAGQ